MAEIEESEVLVRSETSPGENWHNSDGASPHGTVEQFKHHLAAVHGLVLGTKTAQIATRDELDALHAHDHNMHGECGAHEKDKTGRQ